MKKERIQGLDGVRAWAIIMIFFYHLYPQLFKGGFIGVSLFFIMSGFLIYVTTIEKDFLTRKKFHTSSFYAQRLKRIYPSLLIFLGCIAILFTTILPTGVHHLFSEGMSAIGSYNNWYQIAQNKSYFAKMSSGSPFTHLWYLSVQMQFYLLWPIIYLLHKSILERYGIRRANYVFIIGIILSAGLMFILYRPWLDPSRVYYGTDTRLFTFLIGNLLGSLYISNKNSNRPKITNANGIKFSIYVIITAALIFLVDGNKSYVYRGGMLVIDIILSLFIWIIINSPKQSLLLNNRILSFIGTYSFEIYLVHYPIIFYFSHKTRNINLLLTLVIIYLTLIVAVILKLVTTSGVLFITMKLKTLISLTALTGIILLTCQYLISQNPAVQQQNELQASLNHNKKLISKADSKNPPSEKQTSEDMSISMIGDSVTLGAVEALKNDFKDIEISAKEGRQVIQAESIVSNWKKQGSLKKNVVIALGTNGPFTEDVGQSLIDAIGKKHQIYWINTY